MTVTVSKKIPVRKLLEDAGVTLVSKKDSRLMNVLSWLLPWRYAFMNRMWTTVSSRRIHAPAWVDVTGNIEPYRSVILHELVHVAQFKRWGFLMGLGYLFPLVPIPCAYWRWKFEREAYLVQIRDFGRDIDETVDTLWWSYAWLWPKPLMRAWFRREAAKPDPTLSSTGADAG